MTNAEANMYAYQALQYAQKQRQRQLQQKQFQRKQQQFRRKQQHQLRQNTETIDNNTPQELEDLIITLCSDWIQLDLQDACTHELKRQQQEEKQSSQGNFPSFQSFELNTSINQKTNFKYPVLEGMCILFDLLLNIKPYYLMFRR